MLYSWEDRRMGLGGNTFIDMSLHLPYSASASATVQYRPKKDFAMTKYFRILTQIALTFRFLLVDTRISWYTLKVNQLDLWCEMSGSFCVTATISPGLLYWLGNPKSCRDRGLSTCTMRPRTEVLPTTSQNLIHLIYRWIGTWTSAAPWGSVDGEKVEMTFYTFMYWMCVTTSTPLWITWHMKPGKERLRLEIHWPI